MVNAIELCKEENCNDIKTAGDYCRFHYIKNWRVLKEQEAQKKGMSLADYLIFLEKKLPKQKAKKQQPIEEGEEGWVEKRFTTYGDGHEDPADEVIDEIIKDLKITIP